MGEGPACLGALSSPVGLFGFLLGEARKGLHVGEEAGGWHAAGGGRK